MNCIVHMNLFADVQSAYLNGEKATSGEPPFTGHGTVELEVDFIALKNRRKPRPGLADQRQHISHVITLAVTYCYFSLFI